MSIPEFATALEYLEHWPKRIDEIGAESTLHPDFAAVCETLRQYFWSSKLSLSTSGGKHFEQHREIIVETFGFISYNERKQHWQDICKRQPRMVALRDLVEDWATHRAGGRVLGAGDVVPKHLAKVDFFSEVA